MAFVPSSFYLGVWPVVLLLVITFLPGSWVASLLGVAKIKELGQITQASFLLPFTRPFFLLVLSSE